MRRKQNKHSAEVEKQQTGKPNIAVVCLYLDGSVRGELTAKFITTLEPLGGEIYAIISSHPPRLSSKIHVIEVREGTELDVLPVAIVKYLFRQMKATFYLLKIIRKVDLVIFYLRNYQFVTAGILLKLMGKKSVNLTGGLAEQITKWNFRPKAFGIGGIVFPPIFRVLERINFASSDLITVQSESVIDFWGLGRYRRKILGDVLDTYINTDLFRLEKDVNSRRALVGYLGRLGPEKGVMKFVEAIPLILRQHPEVDFAIAGDGPLFETIQNKLAAGNLESKVRLTGLLSHDKEVPEYLNEIKLMVLPSYTEGLPTVVLEAMSCGAIVVSTPAGGVPDIIKEEETGFLLPTNSPQDLAEGIARALEHPRLDKIARKARRVIEERYVYEAIFKRYADLLDEAMKR